MMEAPTAREKLRSATSGAHASLDRHGLMKSLLDADIKNSTYAHLLTGYFAWFGSWEAHMKARLPDLVAKFGAGRFEKSAWLRDDLLALGAPVSPSGPALPTWSDDPAEMAGFTYVAEGSTMGGSHLAKRLPFPGALSFYHSYGPALMTEWKEFIPKLDEVLADPTDCERAIEAANTAFQWFDDMFDWVVAGSPAQSRE